MSVLNSDEVGTVPVGAEAAGRPVPTVTDLLEAAMLRLDTRPVLLCQGGIILATPELVKSGPWICHAETGHIYEWKQVRADRVEDRMLEPSGLLLYRISELRNEDVAFFEKQDDVTGDIADLRKRLLYFRTELCSAGLEQVRNHLSSRNSGGQSTLQHQLVKGMIADVLTVLYMAETIQSDEFVLEQSGISEARTRTWVHQELDEAFRQLQRLGGGFGYLRHAISAYVYAGQMVKNMLLIPKEAF
ncbi:hypothetical protein MKY66_02770 [Paenibacillus sp. FSL R5-0766]|uniref:hypothetical protein n=1 Tax=unclassified Paenibacillus TaxID=185978 RepID=UPI00096EBFB3|nr:hypothetical protein [Paenibacillus sp. FSL R5-0765]OMF61071.1 hypothetical protein BK141_22260 [Paenibacillus sp. FSL R5-0765]